MIKRSKPPISVFLAVFLALVLVPAGSFPALADTEQSSPAADSALADFAIPTVAPEAGIETTPPPRI